MRPGPGVQPGDTRLPAVSAGPSEPHCGLPVGTAWLSPGNRVSTYHYIWGLPR